MWKRKYRIQLRTKLNKGDCEIPLYKEIRNDNETSLNQLFLGLEIAYGQYQPGERGSNGKQQGKLLLFVKTSPMNSGQITSKGKGPALGITPHYGEQ